MIDKFSFKKFNESEIEEKLKMLFFKQSEIIDDINSQKQLEITK